MSLVLPSRQLLLSPLPLRSPLSWVFLVSLPQSTWGRGQITFQNPNSNKALRALADPSPWPIPSPAALWPHWNLMESKAAGSGPQVSGHAVLCARSPTPALALGSASSPSWEPPAPRRGRALPQEQDAGGSQDPGPPSPGSGTEHGQQIDARRAAHMCPCPPSCQSDRQLAQEDVANDGATEGRGPASEPPPWTQPTSST